jgi:glycosyltransferase involved in cell wall biosynthesis
VGGIPEYVRPGGSVVVRPGDSDAICSAIRAFAHDTKSCEEHGARSRRWAESLAWDGVARRTEEVYPLR